MLNKLRYILINVFLFTCVSIGVHASSGNAIDEFIKMQQYYQIYGQSIDAPSSMGDIGTETIGVSDGSIDYEVTDLVLPGKGESVLTLTRRFNSALKWNSDGTSTSKTEIGNRLALGILNRSTKYVYRYYLNGNTSNPPVYIAFDREEDMLEKENGSGQILTSASYTDGAFDTSVIEYVGSNELYKYEVSSNTIGFVKGSLFYLANNLPQGSGVTLVRDKTVACAELYLRGLDNYEFYERAEYENYPLANGWALKLPKINFISSEKDKFGHYTITHAFIDAEMGKVYQISYLLYSTTYGEPIRVQDPRIFNYAHVSGQYNKTYTNNYSISARMEVIDGIKQEFITITRFDGTVFEFNAYKEDLISISDKGGNKMHFLHGTSERYTQITDSLNRVIRADKTGIRVNGTYVVRYTQQNKNNSTIDPYFKLESDNTLSFDVVYQMSSGQKKVRYETSRRSQLYYHDSSNSRNPFVATSATTRKLHQLKRVALSAGGSIEYEYLYTAGPKGIHNLFRDDYLTYMVSKRSEKTKTGELQNSINYTYLMEGNDITRTTNISGKTYYEMKERQSLLYNNVVYKEQRSDEPDNQYYIRNDYTYGDYGSEGNRPLIKLVTTTKNSHSSSSKMEVIEEYKYNTRQNVIERKRDGEVVEKIAYIGLRNFTHIPALTLIKRGNNDWVGTYNVVTATSLKSYPVQGNDNLLVWNDSRGSYGFSSSSVRTNEYTEIIYNSNRDIQRTVSNGVRNVHIYDYKDCTSGDLSGPSLILTKRIDSLEVNNGDSTNIVNVNSKSTYDLLGRLISQSDRKGNVTDFEYDAVGRPVKQINPDLSYSTASYNDSLNEIVLTDETGRKEKISYDDFGRNRAGYLFKNSGYVQTYQNAYDGFGNLLTMSVYNDDLSEKSRMKYEYYQDNRVKNQRSYEGNSTLGYRQYMYTINAPLGEIKTGVRVYKEMSGTHAGNVIVEQAVNKYGYKLYDSIDGKRQTYNVDSMGNILNFNDLKAIDESYAGNTITYAYDYANRPYKTTYADGTYTQDTYNTTTGLLSSRINTGGNTTTITYNTLGLPQMVSTPQTSSVTLVQYKYYDANGNIEREEEKSKQGSAETLLTRTKYDYDTRGRLKSVMSGEGDVVRYEYDAADRITRMATGLSSFADAVNESQHSVTTYSYNDMYMLEKVTDALGNYESYAYNNLGEVLSITDRNGAVKSNIYDGLGRLKKITASGDDRTDEISYKYDYYGNVVEMIDSTGTTQYNYNVMGLMSKEVKGNTIKDYTYDANGNRKTFRLRASGLDKTLTATYDYNNRLKTVTDGTDTTTYVYNTKGFLTSHNTKQGTSVRAETIFTYNYMGLPTTKVNKANGSTVDNYSMLYYADGNLQRVTESGIVTNYVYDYANRLTSESSGQQVTQYEYDAFGNRANKTVTLNSVIQSVTGYEYDKNNRLKEETQTVTEEQDIRSYFYDNNGNTIMSLLSTIAPDNGEQAELNVLTADETERVTMYEYDLFNRLVKTSTGSNMAEYTYNGGGLRQSKTVNGVTTSHIYDGANMVYEKTDGLNGKYYLRGHELISCVEGTVKNYYYTNHHRDVSRITNVSGTPLATYRYDAFGNELNLNENDTNPFRYCGEYTELETNNIYLRNRYYDPSNGRFISEDPARAQTNWYIYCLNNPIRYTDPSGLDIYYYVNTEFRSEAYRDQKALAKEYGEPVHILELNTRADFIDEWNKMGSWDGKDVEVSKVIINSHADPDMLQFSAGENIYASDFIDGTLVSKNIGDVVLLGCNSGHFDHRYSSVANKILVGNNVNSVTAVDGTTKSARAPWVGKVGYWASGNDAFVSHLWSGKKYRDHYGFIKYTKNSAGELEWSIIGQGTYSITKLLEKAGL